NNTQWQEVLTGINNGNPTVAVWGQQGFQSLISCLEQRAQTAFQTGDTVTGIQIQNLIVGMLNFLKTQIALLPLGQQPTPAWWASGYRNPPLYYYPPTLGVTPPLWTAGGTKINTCEWHNMFNDEISWLAPYL